MENDLEQAKNTILSGLETNFQKSDLFSYGEAKEHMEQYSPIFGCGMGHVPFRYLGIPMNHKKLNDKDCKVVEECFQKIE